MIDIIVEALNEISKEGFYVIHKSTTNSIIKSFKMDSFDLYYIKENNKQRVYHYSRTRSITNTFEESEKMASKDLILFLLKKDEQVSN